MSQFKGVNLASRFRIFLITLFKLKVGSLEENVKNKLSFKESLSSFWLLIFEVLPFWVVFFCKDLDRTELFLIYLLN